MFQLQILPCFEAATVTYDSIAAFHIPARSGDTHPLPLHLNYPTKKGVSFCGWNGCPAGHGEHPLGFHPQPHQ